MMYQGTEIIGPYQEKQNILNTYKGLGQNSCFSDSSINDFFSGLNPLFSDALENFYLAAYISFYFGCIIMGIMLIFFVILLFRKCKGEIDEDYAPPKRRK